MSLLAYLRIWLASIRYSVVRTMMFRFDFFLWVLVDISWMAVNLLLLEVLFHHTDSIAGWSKPEMMLLVGTSMLIMRMFIGLFFTNLFSVDRAVREGTFDFYLAQPGNPLFMISTRKVDLDGLCNTILAAGIVVHAVRQMGVTPDAGTIALYVFMVLCGLVIHYATVVMLISLSFWVVRMQGLEGGYFSIFDLSRLPRRALGRVLDIVFVYIIPATIVSNFPAEVFRSGVNLGHTLWLGGVAAAWLAAAATFFHLGLRRYASASS
jgi:ABC-2 type transport system permease protein